VLFLSTGPEPAVFSLPLKNISTDLLPTAGAGAGAGVCIRNLYTKSERYLGVDAGAVTVGSSATAPIPNLEATVAVHDSAFFCVRPAVEGGNCSDPEALRGCPGYAA
jgi:hypothetical protein